MKTNTHKILLAALIIFIMAICIISSKNIAMAEESSLWDESNILKKCSFVFNNEERSLILLKNNDCYLKVGSSEPYLISLYIKDAGFDKYGTIWCIYLSDNAIRWRNNDLLPNDVLYHSIKTPSDEDPDAYVNNADCLIFDDQGYVTGYTDLSDETHPILTLEEMKKELNISDDNTTQTPTPSTPAPTPNNSSTSPSPTTNPTVTPSNKDTTNVTPTPVVTKKSVKKKAGYSCLSVGSKVTSKYKLTKGKLTWKGNGKSKKFSGIKAAGFIKKSGNLVFMTKQGKVYTLSSKGKKKCIVKKKAKKLIVKNKFVVKVKVGKKFINLANK